MKIDSTPNGNFLPAHPSFLRIPHPREFVLSCESHRTSKSTTDSLTESRERKEWGKKSLSREKERKRGRVTEAPREHAHAYFASCMHVCARATVGMAETGPPCFIKTTLGLGTLGND